MKEANELLLNVQFYPCDKKYVGCIPHKNCHCGDCQEPSLNLIYSDFGDCGGEINSILDNK